MEKVILATFDTNVIIDVLDERSGFQYVEALLNTPRIEVAVVSTSASERNKYRKMNNNFSIFEERIRSNSLLSDKVKIIDSIGIWGFSFWGHFIWAGEEGEKLFEEIKKILFPMLVFPPKIDQIEDKDSHMHKWLNKINDIRMIWAHIYHKRDIFITRDTNFLKSKKKEQLEQLGAKHIMTPEEVYKVLNESRNIR